MIRKISNIIYISVLAVVLFACGDDSTIEEQGSGTITARVMASNAYPALEEKVVLKVALNDGQDIQSVVWTMEGRHWVKNLNWNIRLRKKEVIIFRLG